MPIQMELRRIIINQIDDQQVIVLREVDGDRSFPIVIGLFEATSIDRRVRGVTLDHGIHIGSPFRGTSAGAMEGDRVISSASQRLSGESRRGADNCRHR